MWIAASQLVICTLGIASAAAAAPAAIVATAVTIQSSCQSACLAIVLPSHHLAVGAALF